MSDKNAKIKDNMKRKCPGKPTKYIFVTGGVLSGVGKGITAASMGAILRAKGYKVTAQKCDPYLNVDAGLLNPVEHGECQDQGLELDHQFHLRSQQEQDSGTGSQRIRERYPRQ